jgi:lipopolysaccharide/colanic/teichoic acid biosynthesis glycosyltransferase
MNKKVFVIFKFRTMVCNTPSLPTHLVSANASTKFGRFLRKFKIDELPQLANVLLGQMSLVGPRPGLESQIQLTKEREIRGVFSVRPGMTGLSQIRNIDMSDPVKLAKSDAEMISTLSFPKYLKIILVTVLRKRSFE